MITQPWHVTLLGELRVQNAEQVITRFKTQKCAGLLAYLAYFARQMHSREVLVDIFWPESDLDAGRASLSVALSSLRNRLEPPGTPSNTVLRADRFAVGFNPAAVLTDIQEFEETLQACTQSPGATEQIACLKRAVDIYQGPLLPACYEDWIFPEQERLSGLFLDAVTNLTTLLENTGQASTALPYVHKAIRFAPLQEELCQHLMRLSVAAGKPGAALRQYREFEQRLERELGTEPSAALRSFVRQIERDTGLAAPSLSPSPPVVSEAGLQGHFRVERTQEEASVTRTFLMMEVEENAQNREHNGDAFPQAQAACSGLLRREFERYGGQEIQEADHAFQVAFPGVKQALQCAIAVQQALTTPVVEAKALTARIAVHTGDAIRQGNAYLGPVLRYASQILLAAQGSQILVSEATAALAAGIDTDEWRLVDRGVFRLRNTPGTRRLYQLTYLEMAEVESRAPNAEFVHSPNLPLLNTRFFGREQEIAQLVELLASPDARLVTLTGMGGTGKTRLAIAVAERLAEHFRGAVWFVSLADLTDAARLPDAILKALRLPGSPQSEPLEQIVEFLSRQPSLLALDNFEQLVEQGADRARTLLERIPSLTILVTSRQVLGISGEREFAVTPLPTPNGPEEPKSLSLYDSVRLFVDRAQAVLPYFQVTSSNAPAIAELCDRLEGIPLAIELAAARAQVMTPHQMLAQLEDRVSFLVSRRRDINARHRTLKATLEWSYRLLSPELQRFFTRLSVFRGGWSEESAQSVCDEPLALDYSAQLRECSLVLTEEDGAEMRFRMLDTVREYAEEMLPMEERNPVYARHAGVYLAMAEEVEPNLWAAEQASWLNRLEREHNNIRAALAWYMETGHGEEALRFVGALCHFWKMRGYLSEGQANCAKALAHPNAQGRTPARVKALRGAGYLAEVQGEFALREKLYAESLAIRQELGDTGVSINLLNRQAQQAARQGDYAEARTLFEQCLSRARLNQDDLGAAGVLLQLGALAVDHDDLVFASRCFAEDLELMRLLGHQDGIAHVLGWQGRIAFLRGDYTAAKALYADAMTIQRELGNRRSIANLYGALGQVALAESDFVKARDCCIESLNMRRELEDRTGILACLEAFAALFAASGKAEVAVRVYAAAEALRHMLDAPGSHRQYAEIERVKAGLRSDLNEQAFSSAWEAGYAMTWEAAVAYVLRYANTL